MTHYIGLKQGLIGLVKTIMSVEQILLCMEEDSDIFQIIVPNTAIIIQPQYINNIHLKA